jgi:hypothetical protein
MTATPKNQEEMFSRIASPTYRDQACKASRDGHRNDQANEIGRQYVRLSARRVGIKERRGRFVIVRVQV